METAEEATERQRKSIEWSIKHCRKIILKKHSLAAEDADLDREELAAAAVQTITELEALQDFIKAADEEWAKNYQTLRARDQLFIAV